MQFPVKVARWYSRTLHNDSWSLIVVTFNIVHCTLKKKFFKIIILFVVSLPSYLPSLPSLPSPSVLQYSSLVTVCSDVLHSLCSPQRVASLQSDASSASPAALLRVEAWTRAVTAAVAKLKSEFPLLADVVQPFTVGLQEV